MGELTNKNTLITAGNSVIGPAAAQEFDREGASSVPSGWKAAWHACCPTCRKSR